MFKVTMQQIKYLMFIDLPWKKEWIFLYRNYDKVYVNIISFENKNIVFRNQGFYERDEKSKLFFFENTICKQKMKGIFITKFQGSLHTLL